MEIFIFWVGLVIGGLIIVIVPEITNLICRYNRKRRKSITQLLSEINFLKDKITITRIFFEEKLSQCQDNYTLAIISEHLNNLIIEIKRMTIHCAKLEKSILNRKSKR